MKPCPTEGSLYGARLTGRCSVTVCQYAACLGGPICSLSGANTFFLLPFKRSFYLIILEVSKLYLSPNLISVLSFFSFFFIYSIHLVSLFSLPVSDSQGSFTSFLFLYHTYAGFCILLSGMFCVYLQNLNLTLHSGFH